MTDNARQAAGRKPFSEVLDRYLDAKSGLRDRIAARHHSQSHIEREAEWELTYARLELDDYLNEKE